MSDRVPTLTIKWDSFGSPDEFGNVMICGRCTRPTEADIGPGVFVVRSWRPVCDRCTEKEDPALLSTLWKIRAELDRGESGPETEAWLDRLEGYEAVFTREQLAKLVAGEKLVAGDE